MWIGAVHVADSIIYDRRARARQRPAGDGGRKQGEKMGRKLRAALIGFGGMGHCHAANYQGQKDVKLVAICDKNPQVFEKGVAELNFGRTGFTDVSGYNLYRSYRELVAKEKFDILDICLPCPLHARYAIRAMEDGYDVLTEKPMARSLAQVDRMIAASKATGRKLMTAQVVRFMPQYHYVADALREEKLGKLLRLSARRNAGMPSREWYRDCRQSGGALLDLHLHDIDFAQSILGVPETVLCQGITRESGGIDDLMASWFFGNGPIVNIESSWCRGGFDATLAAICENGTYEIIGQKVLIHSRDGKTETLDFAKEKSGYFREIEYFARCVLDGTEPEFCSLESVRRSMQVAFAEDRSARSCKKTRVRA